MAADFERISAQLVEYQALLDDEETRLRALAHVARGSRLKQIEVQLSAIAARRRRVIETLDRVANESVVQQRGWVQV